MEEVALTQTQYVTLFFSSPILTNVLLIILIISIWDIYFRFRPYRGLVDTSK